MAIEKDLTIPPKIEQTPGVVTEWATLGAGCFGPPDMIYTRTIGVLQTQVGYMGGLDTAPTYAKLCAHLTGGHAEVVLVEYDPTILNYEGILDLYFTMFDPTVLNTDNVGKGSQYRSVIFYHDENQRRIAASYLARIQAELGDEAKVVTELKPLEKFYPAEVYQQRYLEKHGQRSFKGCTDPIIKIP